MARLIALINVALLTFQNALLFFVTKIKVFLYSVIDRKEKGTSPRKEDMRTIQ